LFNSFISNMVLLCALSVSAVFKILSFFRNPKSAFRNVMIRNLKSVTPVLRSQTQNSNGKCSKPSLTGHCTPRALPQVDYVILQGASDRRERGNLHFLACYEIASSLRSLADTSVSSLAELGPSGQTSQ